MDALARDARALLAALDGRELGPEVSQAAVLLTASAQTTRAGTRSGRRSTAIARMGAASSSPTWRITTGARPSSRRLRQVGCFAKTASVSTSAPTPSPARAG